MINKFGRFLEDLYNLKLSKRERAEMRREFLVRTEIKIKKNRNVIKVKPGRLKA
jgi:hypothetical protein